LAASIQNCPKHSVQAAHQKASIEKELSVVNYSLFLHYSDSAIADCFRGRVPVHCFACYLIELGCYLRQSILRISRRHCLDLEILILLSFPVAASMDLIAGQHGCFSVLLGVLLLEGFRSLNHCFFSFWTKTASFVSHWAARTASIKAGLS
jgi:hypothetical protein